MKYRRVAAACAAAALTVLTATSAYADIVSNDLEDPNDIVDAEHESMTLYLNPGTSGTTQLRIIEQSGSDGDHAGCNLPGNPHTLTVTPHFQSAYVDVQVSNGGVFESCDDVLTVTVAPVAVVSSTTVWFSYTADVPETPDQGNAKPRTFSVEEADFDVTVLAGQDGGPDGEVCDAEPAAPAWAAALLKGNNVKAKGATVANYISTVAGEMEQRASFHDIEKIDQADYSAEVWAYMKTLSGLVTALPKGPADVAKPGWTCTHVVGTAATS